MQRSLPLISTSLIALCLAVFGCGLEWETPNKKQSLDFGSSAAIGGKDLNNQAVTPTPTVDVTVIPTPTMTSTPTPLPTTNPPIWATHLKINGQMNPYLGVCNLYDVTAYDDDENFREVQNEVNVILPGLQSYMYSDNNCNNASSTVKIGKNKVSVSFYLKFTTELTVNVSPQAALSFPNFSISSRGGVPAKITLISNTAFLAGSCNALAIKPLDTRNYFTRYTQNETFSITRNKGKIFAYPNCDPASELFSQVVNSQFVITVTPPVNNESHFTVYYSSSTVGPETIKIQTPLLPGGSFNINITN